MDTIAALHDSANRPLTEVIETVSPERWEAPSPCEGWTARDVLGHLVDSQREFLVARGADLAPVDLTDDPAGAWRTHTRRVGEILATEGFPETTYQSYFGETTAGATFAQYFLWDMLVHRWDIATATGVDSGFTEEELERIDRGADSFGESLHMEGVCGPAVEVPPSASRADRVFARLGRRA